MKRLGKNDMNVVYSDQKIPRDFNNTIFLAGPTPRSNNVKSWRKEALSILQDLGFEGTILIPEPSDGKTYPNYDNQFNWETKYLENATCILFWIPRELRSDFENIALTTNIEWGMYCKSGKVVVGFPKDSEKNRYIEMQCKNYLNLEVKYDLKNLIEDAIKMAKK